MPDSTPYSHDFIDPKVLARLAGLGLHARLPMLGNVSGRHRSPIRGSSLEFAEYRKYVPGDDTRRVDWRAWGRSDRYYIKEYEADTNLRLCLIADTSGSMNFAANGVSKLDSLRALMLIRAYRIRGHLVADLDPLGMRNQTPHPELDPVSYGFSGPDMDRPIFIDNVLGLQVASLKRNETGACTLEGNYGLR